MKMLTSRKLLPGYGTKLSGVNLSKSATSGIGGSSTSAERLSAYSRPNLNVDELETIVSNKEILENIPRDQGPTGRKPSTRLVSRSQYLAMVV